MPIVHPLLSRVHCCLVHFSRVLFHLFEQSVICKTLYLLSTTTSIAFQEKLSLSSRLLVSDFSSKSLPFFISRANQCCAGPINAVCMIAIFLKNHASCKRKSVCSGPAVLRILVVIAFKNFLFYISFPWLQMVLKIFFIGTEAPVYVYMI